MAIPPSQIKEINKLLLAYGAGQYHKKGKVSKNRDEIDSIIIGVNMLGEELLSTTVSRDYFRSIYDSVANMVFVLTPAGLISDANKPVFDALGITMEEMNGRPLDSFVIKGKKSFFREIKKMLNKEETYNAKEAFLNQSPGTDVPLNCSCSIIIDKNEKHVGYLVVAEDITEKKETEKLILRTIVDTQEKEQKRVAEDLHDSLGQELSTVKLLLSAISESFDSTDNKYLEAYETCKSLLDRSIVNLRSICFDLMPASLENGGINVALEELTDRLSKQSIIKFSYTCKNRLPVLGKSLEIVIYRIAQEFINNTIKHANATSLIITLSGNSSQVSFSIKDNGKGFDTSNAKTPSGRGLSTMDSRARAFNGTMKLVSKPGKGTELLAVFPLKT